MRLWESENGLCNLVPQYQPLISKYTAFSQLGCPGWGKMRESGGIGASMIKALRPSVLYKKKVLLLWVVFVVLAMERAETA